ncbi:hypothetical protein [Shinella sp. M31]|uniref:hypothetical protein n=1 Tax=Shinella sp. M31 TaxID=3368615 RepID=UPI003B9EF783
MSAVLSFVTPDAAYVLTDRAAYDDNGVVRAVHCKVAASEKHPVVVATRGDVRLGDHWDTHLISLIDKIGPLAVQAKLPDVLAALRDNTTVRVSHAERLVEVLVAGWTELGGFHVRFNTRDWRIEELDAFAYGGPMDCDPIDLMERVGLPQAGDTPESWTRRAGVAVMEAFRSQRGRNADGSVSDWFAIGGGWISP